MWSTHYIFHDPDEQVNENKNRKHLPPPFEQKQQRHRRISNFTQKDFKPTFWFELSSPLTRFILYKSEDKMHQWCQGSDSGLCFFAALLNLVSLLLSYKKRLCVSITAFYSLKWDSEPWFLVSVTNQRLFLHLGWWIPLSVIRGLMFSKPDVFVSPLPDELSWWGRSVYAEQRSSEDSGCPGRGPEIPPQTDAYERRKRNEWPDLLSVSEWAKLLDN